MPPRGRTIRAPAAHLLDQVGLTTVTVEKGPNDHYDPDAKAVRLSKANLDGKSLTAVAIDAHVVGHVLQGRDGYAPLIARQRIVALARASTPWRRRRSSACQFSAAPPSRRA